MDLKELEARVAALEEAGRYAADREAIREVIYRYCRGADRCDAALLKSCYFDDATDCHWFFNGNAHEMVDVAVGLLRRVHGSQHTIGNILLDIQGDRAHAESYVTGLHHINLADGREIDQCFDGRYVDVFERRDGVWKILHRHVVMTGMREHVLPGNPLAGTEFEGMAALTMGHPAPADLVYAGFGLLENGCFPIPASDIWEPLVAQYGELAAPEVLPSA